MVKSAKSNSKGIIHLSVCLAYSKIINSYLAIFLWIEFKSKASMAKHTQKITSLMSVWWHLKLTNAK